MTELKIHWSCILGQSIQYCVSQQFLVLASGNIARSTVASSIRGESVRYSYY